MNISLKPPKTFLGYPSTTLLGQRIDGYGLSTTPEKMEAITRLQFPHTLKELETYLGLTGWLRNHIHYYAQIVEPLQRRKTMLLRDAPKTGKTRKSFAARTRLTEATNDEISAFNHLQEVFRKPTFLAHFDAGRRLYIDLDASKAYGFGVVAYHTAGDPGKSEDISKLKIQLILFLSKVLTEAEQ